MIIHYPENLSILTISGHDALRVRAVGDSVTLDHRVERHLGEWNLIETGYVLENGEFIRHSFPYSDRPGHEPACRRLNSVNDILFNPDDPNWNDFQESLHGEMLWYQHRNMRRDESEGASFENLLGRFKFVEDEYGRLMLPRNSSGQPILVERDSAEEMRKPHPLWKNGWEDWTESHHQKFVVDGIHGRNLRGPNGEFLAAYPRGRKNFDISGDLNDFSSSTFENIGKVEPMWLNHRFIIRRNGFIPHREDGPAIVVSEDEETHTKWKCFLEGHMVPDHLVAKVATSLDPNDFINLDNAEIRRLAFDKIGWERVLTEVKARVINQSKNPTYNTKEMVVGIQGERYLIAHCPATARLYALLVSPEVSTVFEAHAFLSGKDPMKCVGQV